VKKRLPLEKRPAFSRGGLGVKKYLTFALIGFILWRKRLLACYFAGNKKALKKGSFNKKVRGAAPNSGNACCPSAAPLCGGGLRLR